jgi:hypothetical protein
LGIALPNIRVYLKNARDEPIEEIGPEMAVADSGDAGDEEVT